MSKMFSRCFISLLVGTNNSKEDGTILEERDQSDLWYFSDDRYWKFHYLDHSLPLFKNLEREPIISEHKDLAI